jgi:hypothetical protein
MSRTSKAGVRTEPSPRGLRFFPLLTQHCASLCAGLSCRRAHGARLSGRLTSLAKKKSSSHTDAKSISRTVFISLSLMALLCPPAAKAQQITPSVADAMNAVNTSAASPRGLPTLSDSTAPNPFERPGSSGHGQADGRDSADSLATQIDRRWASTSAEYAFTAAPSFYSPGRNDCDPRDWDSLISSGITAYLNRSNTTTVRMSSSLDLYGQRREAGATGDPGGQAFTMEWEVSHLLPSKLGPMEVAAGRYQQQLILRQAFPNAPLTDELLGYSMSSAGFETTVTLPDRNLAFSLRYGTQHSGTTVDRSHVAMFELSWTW